MTMVKRTLAIALATALSTSAYADGVDIYGKANVSVQSSDEGDGAFTEVKSNASRIGLKGTQSLSDSLKVVYKAEFQVDMSDDEGDNLKARNQYIGLAGNFGEILLGRKDTALKVSQGKVDLFSDYEADIKVLFKGENRMSDSISYTSPKFGEVRLALSYIAEDSADGKDGYSMSAVYGDASLKKTKVFASIAMDTDVKGYDVFRATTQTKLNQFIIGAMYHTQESEGGAEMDGFMFSTSYKLDKVTLKGQYQVADHKDGDEKTGITLGADYKLGKNTKLFSFFTSFDNDTSDDKDYLAVGVEYKF